MKNRFARGVLVGFAAAVVGLQPLAACAGGETQEGIVQQLMSKDLVGISGKEILMITVKYLAGGASPPHQHNAQVFVYVLDGRVRMQVKGSPTVTLGPGQTFYESPQDVHTVSANASKTKPARILVFMVKDKDAPASTPADR